MGIADTSAQIGAAGSDYTAAQVNAAVAKVPPVAAAPRAAATLAGSFDQTPSPALYPELWDSIGIGPMKYPLVPGEGGKILLKFKSAIKVDKQKASGKDKAKTKVNGVDPVEGTLDVVGTAENWDDFDQFTQAIDPNGPNAGQPWDITHPEAKRRRVKSVLLHKAGELVIEHAGQLFTQKYDVEEWVDPGTAKKDSKVDDEPDTAAKWTSQRGSGGAGDWSADSNDKGSTQTWDGAKAPNAKP